MNALVKLKETGPRFDAVKPESMNYEAEFGFAVQHLKANDFLMTAANNNPESLQRAMVNVAAIGLSLNPAEKQAYLIPRGVKTNNGWQTQVFLDPGYVGLIRLATNSGSIEWVQARAVYEDDDFIDNGAGEKPSHTYKAFSKERGEFVGVYCVAKTKNGDYLTTLMDKGEVESIRNRSEAWKRNQSGPWKTDFNEMAKKAVIRNAFKTWPRTDENQRLSQAVHLSNENEGFAPLVSSPKIGQYTAEQKQYLDQLIEDGDNLGMFVLKETLVSGDENTSIWVSLTNSFERGQKGKYGDIIMQMVRDGSSKFDQIVTALIDSASSGDETAVKEVVGELSDDEYKLSINRLTPEDRIFVEQTKEK